MGIKIIDLAIYAGFLCALLCACSSTSQGKKPSGGGDAEFLLTKRIAPGNAAGVSQLRNLKIPGYLRGDLSQCSLDFSPDGKFLVAACGSNPVPVWEVESGVIRYSLYTEHPVQVVTCNFSPDGTRLACGGFDDLLTLWDTSTGEKIDQFGLQKSPIWELSFSPDGKQIASAALSDDIRLWDADTGEQIWNSTGIKGILSVRFDPRGRTIAYGTRLGTRAGVLNAANGEAITSFKDLKNNVGDITFSSGGELLAAGCDDNNIYLWNSNDYQPVATLTGHAGYVNGVAFSPDGTLLASGSHDKTVGVWDVTGQKQLVSLAGHGEAVLRVAFSPDGKLIASVSWDGTVKLWGIATN